MLLYSMSDSTKLFESHCTCCEKICGKLCREKLNSIKNKLDIDIKYGIKVIPKYSDNYLPYFILRILPKYWFKNNVRCDKCYSRFYSDDIPQFCEKCINNIIPINTNCIKCNRTYSSTPNKIKLKHNLCTNCFNIYDSEFICNICRCKFIDTHSTYNDLNAAICKMCRNSNKIKHKYLHFYQKFNKNNETINKMLDISDKKIKIYYKVTNQKHSGYCLDHDENDVKTNIYTEEKIFPLMNDLINLSNEILNNLEKFHYYYTPSEETTCAQGCYSKKYEIDNFEIIY